MYEVESVTLGDYIPTLIHIVHGWSWRETMEQAIFRNIIEFSGNQEALDIIDQADERARVRFEAGPSVDVPAAVTGFIPPKPKTPITVCPNCDAPVAECGCGWHCAKGLHERCMGLGCKCWHHRERLD